MYSKMAKFGEMICNFNFLVFFLKKEFSILGQFIPNIPLQKVLSFPKPRYSYLKTQEPAWLQEGEKFHEEAGPAPPDVVAAGLQEEGVQPGHAGTLGPTFQVR